jgi:hypothetical protein
MLAAAHLTLGGLHLTVNVDDGIERACALLSGQAELPREAPVAYRVALRAWQVRLPRPLPAPQIADTPEAFAAASGDRPLLVKLRGTIGLGAAGLVAPFHPITDEAEETAFGDHRVAAIERLARAVRPGDGLLRGRRGLLGSIGRAAAVWPVRLGCSRGAPGRGGDHRPERRRRAPGRRARDQRPRPGCPRRRRCLARQDPAPRAGAPPQWWSRHLSARIAGAAARALAVATLPLLRRSLRLPGRVAPAGRRQVALCRQVVALEAITALLGVKRPPSDAIALLDQAQRACRHLLDLTGHAEMLAAQSLAHLVNGELPAATRALTEAEHAGPNGAGAAGGGDSATLILARHFLTRTSRRAAVPVSAPAAYASPPSTASIPRRDRP